MVKARSTGKQSESGFLAETTMNKINPSRENEPHVLNFLKWWPLLWTVNFWTIKQIFSRDLRVHNFCFLYFVKFNGH